MARNILLTSISRAETELPVRYYSFKKEFASVYCDALLDAEAGIKAVLSMHDIDEIIVIGGAGSYDENDELNPVDLGHGNTLYSKDEASLSAYALPRGDGRLPSPDPPAVRQHTSQYDIEEVHRQKVMPRPSNTGIFRV